jgi:hypothetical protein
MERSANPVDLNGLEMKKRLDATPHRTKIWRVRMRMSATKDRSDRKGG